MIFKRTDLNINTTAPKLPKNKPKKRLFEQDKHNNRLYITLINTQKCLK